MAVHTSMGENVCRLENIRAEQDSSVLLYDINLRYKVGVERLSVENEA